MFCPNYNVSDSQRGRPASPCEISGGKNDTVKGSSPSTSDFPCLDCVWNVMAHAQKPDFVFRRNGRVHLNRRGRQFSRLLAAELCASAVVMLDTPCSEVVWRVLATHCIRQFPLHFPPTPLRHRVPSLFSWSLLFHHFSSLTHSSISDAM